MLSLVGRCPPSTHAQGSGAQPRARLRESGSPGGREKRAEEAVTLHASDNQTAARVARGNRGGREPSGAGPVAAVCSVVVVCSMVVVCSAVVVCSVVAVCSAVAVCLLGDGTSPGDVSLPAPPRRAHKRLFIAGRTTPRSSPPPAPPPPLTLRSGKGGAPRFLPPDFSPRKGEGSLAGRSLKASSQHSSTPSCGAG